MRFRSLLHERVELEAEPASFEVESRMRALEEEIASLPGFPRGYDPDRDVIVPLTSSTQR
jgi:hypothetical protein